MQIRLLIATLMLLLAMAGKAQVFQTNNTPYKFRGVKADSLLIAAKGCDTAYLSNPKWGTSTAGALYVDTCNNRFYFHNGVSWSQVSGGGGGVDSFYYNLRSLNDTTAVYDRGDRVDTLVIRGGIGQFVDSVTTVGDSLYYWKGGTAFFSANLALAAAGGDTTIFEQITDSTGNDNFRVLYAFNGKISGSFPFRYVPAFRRVIISPTSSVSANYDTVRLVVDGAILTGKYVARSGLYTGIDGGVVELKADSIKFTPTPTATDTTTYKPAGLSSTGALVRLNRWPGSGGADTTGMGDLFIRNQSSVKEAKTFNIRSGRLDSLYASGSGGVHFATNSGASAFEYGGGGGTQVTFNGFAGYNANRAASYTARSFPDVNYTDSSIAAVPTVTSYGKNAGGDSTILLLSNGQRFAAKDSTGAGGGGGVTTVGTFSGSSQTNGASISGSTITFGPADATNPGMVSTGAQTWAGAKTINNELIFTGGSTRNSMVMYDGGASNRLGIGLAGTSPNSLQFYVRPFDAFTWNGSGGAVNTTTNEWMRLTSSALDVKVPTTFTGGIALISQGAAGGAKQYYYDAGAGNRIGVAIVSASTQNFIRYTTDWFSWNIGGAPQPAGTNELMRIVGNGQVGIGTSSPNISAQLDLSSTTRGFLPPRMTTTQMNAISSPAAGLQVYNTTTSQPNYRDGSTWQAQVGMTFGTAAPTSTPTAVGNFFLDTTNKKIYVATGTASSADWNILN